MRLRGTCHFCTLQISEGKFTMSPEIEPVRRSFRRHGSRTFAEVARLVPSGQGHGWGRWGRRKTRREARHPLRERYTHNTKLGVRDTSHAEKHVFYSARDCSAQIIMTSPSEKNNSCTSSDDSHGGAGLWLLLLASIRDDGEETMERKRWRGSETMETMARIRDDGE